MQSAAKLTERVECYALVDAGVAPWAGPRWAKRGEVWGRLHPMSGTTAFGGLVQPGEQVDAVVFVRDSAPLVSDGMVRIKGRYYTVQAVDAVESTRRLRARLTRVEREKLPADDAPVAALTVTPATFTVPTTLATFARAAVLTATDAAGFPLVERYMTVRKTTALSGLFVRVRGDVVDVVSVPSDPVTGETFVFTSEGQTATFVVDVVAPA